MGEDKFPILDGHGCFSGASIVCILKEFRYDMAGALNLFKQLMPWAGEFRVTFKLIPALGRPGAYRLKIWRLAGHRGPSERSSNSAKS
jgi:hypothetical protein